MLTSPPSDWFSGLNHTVTLQFLTPLEGSADPWGGRGMELKHFTTIDFSSGPPLHTDGFTRLSIEKDFVYVCPGRIRRKSTIILYAPRESNSQLKSAVQNTEDIIRSIPVV